MGKYEILYIIHPDLEASIDKIIDKVRFFIETRGGKITYEENWGKRKLAYEIKKTNVGIYLLWYFESPQESIAKIERDIRLTEEIIRYMITAKSDKITITKPIKREKQVAEEIKKEEPKKEKVAVKPKKEKVTKVSEAERMKKLDEQLGVLLGEKEDDKKVASKAKKEKK